MEEGILANVIDKIIKDPAMEENGKIFNLNSMNNESLLAQAAQVLMCCNATMMAKRVNGKRTVFYIPLVAYFTDMCAFCCRKEATAGRKQ